MFVNVFKLLNLATERRPHIVGGKISDTTKKQFDSLLDIEKRKQSEYLSILLEEYLPLKVKIHDQKNIPVDISIEDSLLSREGAKIKMYRHPQTGMLVMESIESTHSTPSQIPLTEEDLESLIANLLIFRKEKEVYGGR